MAFSSLRKSNFIGLQACMLSCFSHVRLFATPWTVAHQAPLSTGFSRQEYWSGLPCRPPGDLPDPRIEPESLASPALAGGFFTTESPEKLISMFEHSIIQNLIPQLLRLNCRLMPNTSRSDTSLPLVQAPILFCVLFTLIHDNSGREPA